MAHPCVCYLTGASLRFHCTAAALLLGQGDDDTGDDDTGYRSGEWAVMEPMVLEFFASQRTPARPPPSTHPPKRVQVSVHHQ